MTLTVRLDPGLERRLESACKRRRTTRSAVVTSLAEEIIARGPEASAYEVAARLGVVGCGETGPVDAAAHAKRYLRRRIGAKHRR